MRKDELSLDAGSPPASRAASTRCRYRLGLTVAVSATALACIGLTAAASARVDAAKPVLRIGLFSGDVNDPCKTGNGPGNTKLELTYAPLIHWQKDGSFGPALATSWRYIGFGNKNFELTLRRDARFSDGAPVTAQAVKTSLLYCSKAGSPVAATMGPIRSIETVGKWVVRLHLASPNPMLVRTLSDAWNFGFIVSPKAAADPSIFGTQTAGAGPYVLVPSQTVSGDHYTYVPNKFYYDKGGIRYRQVVVKIISNPSTMLQAARTGQLDVAWGDTATADAAASAGLSVIYAPVGVAGLFFLNRSGTLAKPLADVRVRQAMNYAIDRKAITSALEGKYGSPTSEMLTADAYDPKLQNYYPYNPAKAKSLLAAAGYPNGFTLSVLNGTFCGCVLVDPLTQAMAKYYDEVGIKFNLTTSATGGDWFQKWLSGEFPAFVMPWASVSPMWAFYGFHLKPNSLTNYHGGQDPVMDKLWLKGQRAPAKQASEIWLQMIRRTVTEADFVPVFTYSWIYYVGKHVGGVSFTAKRPGAPPPGEWFPR